MAIVYEEDGAKFSAIIYEDETVNFRDYLQNKAGENLRFEFTECEDIHFSVLQLIMAYKKVYSCTYLFAEETKMYEKFLKGFNAQDEICN